MLVAEGLVRSKWKLTNPLIQRRLERPQSIAVEVPLFVELDDHVSNSEIPASSATRRLVENAAEIPIHAAHVVENFSPE